MYVETRVPGAAFSAPMCTGGRLAVVISRVFHSTNGVYPLAVSAKAYDYSVDDKALLANPSSLELPVEGYATLSYPCVDKAPGVCGFDSNGAPIIITFDGSSLSVSRYGGSAGYDFIYYNGCVAYLDSNGVHAAGDKAYDTVLSAVIGDKLYVAIGDKVYSIDPSNNCQSSVVKQCQGLCRVGWGEEGLVVLDTGSSTVYIGSSQYTNVNFTLEAGGDYLSATDVAYLMELYGSGGYLVVYRSYWWYTGLWRPGDTGVTAIEYDGRYRLAWVYPVLCYDNGVSYTWDYIVGVEA